MSRSPSSPKEELERKIKVHHDKEMLACKALPTMGRNQSMFDENNFTGMQDLKMSNTSGPRLDLLQEEGEEEEEEANTGSMVSGVSHFLHDRVDTFAHNLDAVAGKDSTRSAGTSSTCGGTDSTRSGDSNSSSRASGVVSDFLHDRVDTFTHNLGTIGGTFSRNMNTIGKLFSSQRKLLEESDSKDRKQHQ